MTLRVWNQKHLTSSLPFLFGSMLKPRLFTLAGAFSESCKAFSSSYLANRYHDSWIAGLTEAHFNSS